MHNAPNYNEHFIRLQLLSVILLLCMICADFTCVSFLNEILFNF